MNFPSVESMFDPATGADYAAQFLRSLYRLGNWSTAAGAYHSQTPRGPASTARASTDPRRPRRFAAGRGRRRARKLPAAPTPPRKSRTRLSGPKIINLPKKPGRRPAEEREALEGGRRSC